LKKELGSLKKSKSESYIVKILVKIICFHKTYYNDKNGPVYLFKKGQNMKYFLTLL